MHGKRRLLVNHLIDTVLGVTRHVYLEVALVAQKQCLSIN